MNVAEANVTVVAHPLAAGLLARLRDERTETPEFRRCLDGLTTLLVAEALAAAPVRTITVRTPLGSAQGSELAAVPMAVPVLRAGLGMLDAALRLLPAAAVGFVGMRRVEHAGGGVSHECYLESLPVQARGGPALVLDPMLATGGSAAEVVRLLRGAGIDQATVVCALAAPEGIATVRGECGDVPIVTAAIDSHLDDRAFIVPGLGDAGDRLYGDA